MNNDLQCTIIDGIKCYSPEVANAYIDYPVDGFDLTERNVESSFWVNSRNRLFKYMVNCYLSSANKTRFLEIGCGTGDFIRQLAKNENLDITGSEVYLKGLHYAKRNLPNIDFIQFDVTQGKIGSLFDIIVAFDVIEHIDNDIAALSNIHGMLGKDGVFIVSVPQHMYLWSKLDELVKHKRRYSRKELISKLEETGFNISYVTSFLFTLFPLMLVARIIDKGKNSSDSSEVELEKRTRFSGVLNWVFDLSMRIDEVLIRSGISLPFGGTLVAIARKF